MEGNLLEISRARPARTKAEDYFYVKTFPTCFGWPVHRSPQETNLLLPPLGCSQFCGLHRLWFYSSTLVVVSVRTQKVPERRQTTISLGASDVKNRSTSSRDLWANFPVLIETVAATVSALKRVNTVRHHELPTYCFSVCCRHGNPRCQSWTSNGSYVLEISSLCSYSEKYELHRVRISR